MMKKIDELLNWILVALFIALACCGGVAIPALAVSFAIIFIIAVIARMAAKKEDNNIIEFKRKD